jgi:hypothetical protein
MRVGMRRRLRAAAVLSIVGAVYGGVLWCAQPAQKRVGQFAEREIMAKSAALGLAIIPNEGMVRYTAVSSAVPSRFGTMQKAWLVDGTADRTGRVVSFVWNAATGDLICAAARSPEPRNAAPLSRQEAVSSTRRWLRSLGLTRGTRTWRLAKPPARQGRAWVACWATEDRRVTVNLDVATGALLVARVDRRPLIEKHVRTW